MNATLRMRQYQQQAVGTASPEQLIAKLYDFAVMQCHRGDRVKLRAALVELTSSLNFEQGGEISERLYALYQFCIVESATGDLEPISEVLSGLRDAWKESMLMRRAA